MKQEQWIGICLLFCAITGVVASAPQADSQLASTTNSSASCLGNNGIHDLIAGRDGHDGLTGAGTPAGRDGRKVTKEREGGPWSSRSSGTP